MTTRVMRTIETFSGALPPMNDEGHRCKYSVEIPIHFHWGVTGVFGAPKICSIGRARIGHLILCWKNAGFSSDAYCFASSYLCLSSIYSRETTGNRL